MVPCSLGTGNTAGNTEAHSPYLPGVLSWGGRQTAATLMNTAEPLRTRPRAAFRPLGPQSKPVVGGLAHWDPEQSSDFLARREFPLLPPLLGVCQEACPAVFPPSIPTD